MSQAERILFNRTGVRSLESLLSALKILPEPFFQLHFDKSKQVYTEEVQRLFEQVNNDYHFVFYLKRQEFEFQLKWKESVLIGHLNILILGLGTSGAQESTSSAVA